MLLTYSSIVVSSVSIGKMCSVKSYKCSTCCLSALTQTRLLVYCHYIVRSQPRNPQFSVSSHCLCYGNHAAYSKPLQKLYHNIGSLGLNHVSLDLSLAKIIRPIIETL